MTNKAALVKYPMKISEPTFEEFRVQFDAMLRKLLTQMMADEVETAQISCKFDVILVAHDVEDVDTGMMTNVRSPLVKHKITSTIQHKTEANGGFGTRNYYLVWNRDTAQYEMVSIQVPQQSMFDDSYEYGENADKAGTEPVPRMAREE